MLKQKLSNILLDDNRDVKGRFFGLLMVCLGVSTFGSIFVVITQVMGQ